jgi:hypothetical protein
MARTTEPKVTWAGALLSPMYRPVAVIPVQEAGLPTRRGPSR